MICGISRGHGTYEPPYRVPKQADGYEEKDKRPSRLAPYLTKSAAAIRRSRRTAVNRYVNGEIGDQNVNDGPGAEASPGKQFEPTPMFDVTGIPLEIRRSSPCVHLRLGHPGGLPRHFHFNLGVR
jgi:hypothetical protein